MGHKPHQKKEKLINQKKQYNKNLCKRDSENLEEQMQYVAVI
jgi:hypothetical protein